MKEGKIMTNLFIGLVILIIGYWTIAFFDNISHLG